MQTPKAKPKDREHRARITWSDAQVQRGLPAFSKTTDPAWTDGSVPKLHEGWSLMCSFEVPPNEQGNPSIANVQFLVEKAPHALLVTGARLHMFERQTSQLALVEILD